MTTKRAQGEGTIHRRKNSTLWIAQISLGGQQITKYFKTQGQGLDWLQTIRTQVQEGLTYDSTRITLEEFMVQWLGSIRTSIRPKTHNQYSYIALKQIIPTLGKIKLKDLHPEQIQALYNAKLDNGISQRTVQLIHVVLHRSLGQALKQGLIIRNPTQAVTRPRVSHKEMMVLSGDQARTFLSAAQDTRYEALFYLAIQTGMREGELLGLKWSDLDWVTKRLQVKRQLQHVSGQGLVFTEPKSAAGRRMIVLDSKRNRKASIPPGKAECGTTTRWKCLG